MDKSKKSHKRKSVVVENLENGKSNHINKKKVRKLKSDEDTAENNQKNKQNLTNENLELEKNCHETNLSEETPTEHNNKEENKNKKKRKPKSLKIENNENDGAKEEVQVDNNLTTVEEKRRKKISKRQQKKQKQQAKEEAMKCNAHKVAVEKALNYISKWKHARNDWKFEKVRQTWLINNIFDETCIPDVHFSTLLEYFEGVKGLARELLLKKGNAVIEKVENTDENEEITETTEYKRARLLLQSLTN